MTLKLKVGSEIYVHMVHGLISIFLPVLLLLQPLISDTDEMDDLSLEVENMKILLQNVTDELSLLKQKSQSDQENLCSKQREIEHLNTEMKWYKTVENRDNSELESCKSEVKKQAAKLKKVQELFSDAEVALLEKEDEISSLNEIIGQNRIDIKVIQFYFHYYVH